ncbi:carotenoid oxygenase family protein [Bosea caraganae]|nr:carotenoid oxygenase family protein [Bosea caraganae]
MTRRDFGLAAGAAAAALSLGGPASAEGQVAGGGQVARGGQVIGEGLVTADITWTSDDPHLSGNFASIGPEIEARDLPVIFGRIPPELSGAYMRNGPNPLFKPLSYFYPMDGDGMIHAVYLDNGKARYRNRFVATASLAVEKRANQAVYGSFAHPVPVDPTLLRPGDNPGPFKNGAFINILQHGGHLLALNEATTCYEMTMELDTIGEWTAGTGAPISLGAHNRKHPRTGSLFALAYTWRNPVVQFHEIDASAKLVRSFSLTMSEPTMIHDFILTERYIVLVAGPVVFDVQAAQSGQSMLQWRPSMGTRIAVVPLDGGDPVWLQADPFFVFHFANGFERGGDIVIDYVRHHDFGGPAGTTPLHRLEIDLASRRIRDTALAALTVEFPRINEAREALRSRYVYVPTLSDSLRIPSPPSATFNTLLKVDTETGESARHDFGNHIVGEAVFVPRGGQGEDDGYLAIFSYDPVAQTSDFVLLDAARVDSEPVAVVRLPQRVPQGLHGNWIPRS